MQADQYIRERDRSLHFSIGTLKARIFQATSNWKFHYALSSHKLQLKALTNFIFYFKTVFIKSFQRQMSTILYVADILTTIGSSQLIQFSLLLSPSHFGTLINTTPISFCIDRSDVEILPASTTISGSLNLVLLIKVNILFSHP